MLFLRALYSLRFFRACPSRIGEDESSGWGNEVEGSGDGVRSWGLGRFDLLRLFDNAKDEERLTVLEVDGAEGPDVQWGDPSVRNC